MKLLFISLVVIIFSHPSPGQIDEEVKVDIRKVAQSYLDGWYYGDETLMSEALHPDLIKRMQAAFKPTGGQVINSISKSQLVEMTKAGFGKSVPREKLISEINVLSEFKDMATVEAISYQYVDYFHMVKTVKGWKILNILWTSK